MIIEPQKLLALGSNYPDYTSKFRILKSYLILPKITRDHKRRVPGGTYEVLPKRLLLPWSSHHR